MVNEQRDNQHEERSETDTGIIREVKRRKRKVKNGDNNTPSEGLSNLEGIVIQLCDMCGLKEWKWIDTTQPELKWHVCEDCVAVSHATLFKNVPKERTIIVVDEEPDPDAINDAQKEEQTITELEAGV